MGHSPYFFFMTLPVGIILFIKILFLEIVWLYLPFSWKISVEIIKTCAIIHNLRDNYTYESHYCSSNFFDKNCQKPGKMVFDDGIDKKINVLKIIILKFAFF